MNPEDLRRELDRTWADLSSAERALESRGPEWRAIGDTDALNTLQDVIDSLSTEAERLAALLRLN